MREWFSELGFKRLKPASLVWGSYNDFSAQIYDEKKSEGFKHAEIENIPIREYLDWIDEKM